MNARFASLFLGVCVVTGITSWNAVAATLDIAIHPTFGGQPLTLDTSQYTNSAAEAFSVTRLSGLLSGFALERYDGSWLEFTNQYARFDAQQRPIIRLKAVAPGDYRSLRFHVGLDPAANHANPAQFPPDHPLNANLNGLHWDWQGGYIFMALEGHYRSGATNATDGFSYHFARDQNRTAINLPAQINLAHDVVLLLTFDVATLLNAPRPLSFVRDGASTHSRTNDPITARLTANFPGAFRVQKIELATISALIPTPTVQPLYLPEKFTPFPFEMSALFPIPDLPRDNPLTVERVTLGRKLFHETALSKDHTLACASCHKTETAFSDSRKYSVGIRDQVGTRNAMPLFNLAWKKCFFWDGRAPSLRAQALMPIADHTEMDETLTNVVAKLAVTNDYPALFTAAFGASDITPEKISLAIESFVLTLTSFDSKFDRVLSGKEQLTPTEQRGFELFMTEYEPRTQNFGADCFHCHGGPLFSDHQFHNNGLNFSETDPGRYRTTKLDRDRGRFSTPSLRNIALTAPYMHDGQFKTLEEVVSHYDHGVQRSPTLDPNLAKHPPEGLRLSKSDQAALVAFLKTLTDERFSSGK